MRAGSRIGRWLLIGPAVLMTILGPAPGRAQGVTTGTISGTVRDTEGRPVEGVGISVSDSRTGAATRVLTNESGRYFVPHLQPGGPYAVEARRLGYGEVVRRGVQVTLGQSTSLDFDLAPSPIEVPALSVRIVEGALFSGSRTDPRTTITESELAAFPTVGRQITDYLALSPLTIPVRDGPSVAGQNFRYNGIQIDGAVSHDLFGLTDSGIPGGEGNARAISVEALEEIQVLAAPFDVRHSGFTGGLINTVTRSGTNRWKGSAFGYHINEDWVSRPDARPVTEFDDSRFGWTLGGPLLRDRLFLFTSGELQVETAPAPGPAFAPGAPPDVHARTAGIHPDSAQRFIELLEGLGIREVGTTGEISLANPRANLFARLDLVPTDRLRIVLRHNLSQTSSDQPPRRGLSEFRLSSSGRRFEGTTHSTIGQVFSRVGRRWHAETILNFQLVRLERRALADFPLVKVEVASEFEGETLTRTLVAGADENSQSGNALDQDIVQFTNHLIGELGRHGLTIGAHGELFRFRHRFFPRSLGVFRFESLDALEANAPSEYAVNTTTPGLEDPAAEWSLFSLAGFIQDHWSVNDRLTLSFGLRVDLPIFPDRPRPNPSFEEAFGFGTARSPRADPLIQPRLGFNWRVPTGSPTQVRGGLGLFAGRPSFVWLSNAFSNTGNTFAPLACAGPQAPRLDPADYPASPPQRCSDGTPPSPRLATVDVTDPDFGFPLDLKLSLGVDRALPAGFSATADLLYSRSLRQPFLRELNLVEEPVAFDPAQGNRPLFGTPTAAGFDPIRQSEDFAHVVQLTNGSGARALLLMLGLHHDPLDWLRLRSSYSYSDVGEKQALFFPLAPFGFAANPIRGNPNDPELSTSPFERRHGVVVSATTRFRLGGGFLLSLTPQFFANSGAPYSYTVHGDVNGDGYRSAAPPVGRDNDVIYVPRDPGEVPFRNPADAAAFDAFIESEPCLGAQRGRLMRPNSCFAPWRQRWDLRGVIGMPGGPRGARLELVLDVLNVFGQAFEQPPRIDMGTSILRVAGRVGGEANGPLLFDFVGPADRAGVFQVVRPDSQRRFQAGLRYRF